MGEQLSPLDSIFLELEQADESAHMHIGGVLVFDGPAPTLDEFRSDLIERLGALPRYRQRLSNPHVGGLSWPRWEADDGFDITRHVHRAALPAPGGELELMEWVSDYWSHRLDRRHPLWDTYMVEGLEGGRWAICNKTHHCMVDGVGSLDVGRVLLDDSPEPREPVDGRLAVPPPRPAAHRLTGTLRAGAGLALHPRRLAERAVSLAALVVRDELISAPRTGLNRPIGTARSFRVVRVPLADLKAIKAALGGTVNDVALAAAAGGLRQMLLERGELPPAVGLRAMVPVNLREAGDQLALGNRITSLFVPIAVGEAEPLDRYRATMRAAESLKSGSQALGGLTMLDLASLAPPVLHAMIAQMLYASRLFNVTITNVPGPQTPLYASGRRLRELSGLVPLAADHGVGIAILSYDGMVTFGLIADRDTTPDLGVLEKGIDASLAELRVLAASHRRARRRRLSHPKKQEVRPGRERRELPGR